MGQYNTQFKMQDLLMNPQLANVFPQFDKNKPLQNVYSFAEVEKKVLEYLKSAFNGEITGSGELIVNGKKKSILRQVRALQTTIEAFFNSMPSIAKNLRSNTKLYTPFASLKQLEELKDPQKKLAAITAIMENIQYNSNFNSQNSLPSQSPIPFQKRQEAWKKKVGYKE